MFRNAIALTAALVLTACGGSGGLSIGPQDQEIGIPANAFRTGYVKNTGDVYTQANALLIRVGDYTNNSDYARGFVSFPISGLPAGATILEANLYIGQEAVNGNPFADLGGQVRVDHMDLGAALDAGDFWIASASVITNSIGVISLDPTLEQKGVVVTAEVQADYAAARNNSEFRFRFSPSKSNDGEADDVRFNTPNDLGGSGFVPMLVIRYEE